MAKFVVLKKFNEFRLKPTKQLECVAINVDHIVAVHPDFNPAITNLQLTEGNWFQAYGQWSAIVELLESASKDTSDYQGFSMMPVEPSWRPFVGKRTLSDLPDSASKGE